MFKFKMKVLLVLGLSAFMTITMIIYVNFLSDFSGLNIFYSSKKGLQDTLVVNSDSKSEKESISNVFIWKNLIRNPMLSFSLFNDKNASQSALVDSNLSQVIYIANPSYTNREIRKEPKIFNFSYANELMSIKSEPEANNMRQESSNLSLRNSRVYTIKPIIVSPVSFVNIGDNEFVNISVGAVEVRSIDRFFDNKTVLNFFQSRRDLMLEECAKEYNDSSMLYLRKDKLEHILVDEKNKMLFCYVPKVACTNWRRMFLLLTGKSNNISYVTSLPSYEVHAKNMLASLQNYSAIDIHFFVRNYSKFMFVRNPLERLLSAYRNKLEQHYNSSKYFQARFGKYIVKHFRTNPSNSSLLKGDDVTFAEFVKYLVSSSRDRYNEHWQTMNDLCHPCFLKYDIIGKYDTLMRDSKAVLEMFHVNYPFPSLPKPSKTASSLKDYYKQLPKPLIKKLWHIYEMDFRLFNYTIEDTIGV